MRQYALGPRAHTAWQQSTFDEFEKGNAKGIAVRSEGRLELAPSFRLLTTTPSTYIWAIAADKSGGVYLAAGAPARVYAVTPDGKSSVIFEPQELQVQSLVVDDKGVIYAATSPDGKVYRLEHRSVGAKQGAEPEGKAGPAKSTSADWTASVFFDPHAKYIWALGLDRENRLYVATGDHGEIYRVTPDGQGSLFFKTDEAHIRAIAFDAQGNVIAGSDGSGLIYRISPKGEAFVLYSAPKKEITALALDSAGNIYAAAAGEKRAVTSPAEAPASAGGGRRGGTGFSGERSWRRGPGNGPGFPLQRAFSRPGRHRLRNLPDCAGWLAQADLEFARRSGLCPRFRRPWGVAGRQR